MKLFFKIQLLFILVLFLSPNHIFAQGESNPAESKSESSEEDTPVVLEEIAGERDLTGVRNWRSPDYSGQQGSLGWTPSTFEIPKGLEINFQFWLDIYTKYTTDQGLLHDSEHIDLIYEILDFTHISSRTDLTEVQKSKQRTKAVKEAKKRIAEMLKKLQKIKDPATLSADEKRIWDAFLNVSSKNKFIDASKKNRLRFQLGQRDRIVQGIFFSGRYLEDFEKLFKEAGLPIELTRLPFVESSFNVLARSKVGASGLWQIMRYTGRPYMMINNVVDKRNLPIEATKLAAKLFRINYNMLESWPLAITGYNHGPAGVLKLTKIYKSRELGDLVQNIGSHKHLGFASRNFYVSFLAVLEAEKNAPLYFGPLFWSKPLAGEEIILPKPTHWKEIVKWFDGKDQVAQIYNPHISSSARKFGSLIPKKVPIYILTAKKEIIMNDLFPTVDKSKVSKTENKSNDNYLNNSTDFKLNNVNENKVTGTVDDKEETPDPSSDHIHTYNVVKGDSLYSIARDFGVSFKELLEANKLENPEEIKVGQKIKIP